MATVINWVVQRFMRRYLRAGTVVDVPISDDLLARVSVIETVAAMPAGGMGSRLSGALYETRYDNPVPLADAVTARVTRALPYMQRCDVCMVHETSGRIFRAISPQRYHGIVRPRARMTREPDNWSDHPMRPRVWDTLGLILPYMCVHGMAELRNCPDGRCQTFSRFPGVPFGARSRAVIVDDPGFHKDGCPGSLNAPLPIRGYDSFGPYQTGWDPRDLRLTTDFSCVACQDSNIGCIDAGILYYETSFESAGVADGFIRSMMWARAAWEVAGSPTHAQVTAWSANYCPVEDIDQFLPFCIVLVNTLEEYDAVKQRGLVPITTPRLMSGGRAQANWRVWIAESLPVGTVVAVTNCVIHKSILLNLQLEMRSPIESSGYCLHAPTAHFCLVVAGSTWCHLTMPTTVATSYIHVYCLDEFVLGHATPWVTRADHHIRGLEPIEFFKQRYTLKHPIILRMPGNEYVCAKYGSRYVTMATVRQAIASSHAASERPSWRDMTAMPLGEIKPDVDEPDVEVLNKGKNVYKTPVRTPATVSQALAADIGVVNWIVFGSHGDLVPVRAVARHLRRWGITVNVICPHTVSEGVSMLADAETGNLLHSAPIYARGIAVASSVGGFVIGPPEFSSVDLGLSLRPPYGIIRPVDFSIGIIGNFILDRGLRGWAPIVNIGAYSGVHWLPRSADGRNFLKYTDNSKPRDIDIMLAWGSSTMPKPSSHGFVEVQPGDHFSQFERAKIVVTHGGAGTVQTAAAAGARVIAGTRVLDRGYIDLTNAGSGITLGVDPDRAMLMFIAKHPRVFLWAWKHSFTMFWHACLWWGAWVLPGSIWLGIALFYNSIMFVVRFPTFRVVMSTNLLATIIASWVQPYVGKLIAASSAPMAAQTISYVVDMLGYSGSEVFFEIVSMLSTLCRSSVVWFLLLRGWGWYSIPGAFAVSALRVVSTVVAEGAALVLVPSASNSDTPMTKVGISWAFDTAIVPVLHTRFLCPEVGERVEGQWSTNHRGMGKLYTIGKRPWVEDNPHEWRFTTAIPWSSFDGLADVSAPYSPSWNCQSAMLHVTRGFWMSLGLSAVVLAPSIVFMYGSIVIILLWTVLVLAFIEVVPVIVLVMTVIGKSDQVPHMHAIAHNALSMLVSTRNGVPSAATAIVNGFVNGWADPVTKSTSRGIAAMLATDDRQVLSRLLMDACASDDVLLMSLVTLKRDLIMSREKSRLLRWL